MDAIKFLFSGIVFSISSLFSQSSVNVPMQTTPPIRAMRPSSIVYPFSSSAATESRFRAATTTERTNPVKPTLPEISPAPSSQVNMRVIAKPSTAQTPQKKTAQPAATSSQVVPSSQPASSSVYYAAPAQGSGGFSQQSAPLTDDPDQPLPDTGNPCDILDEGASCILNGISGTCQIQGEAITCMP